MADAETKHCEHCGEVPASAGPCPRSFTCPSCQAKPGEWCKRPSEHRAPSMHAERLALEFQCPKCHADGEPASRNRLSSTKVEYRCPNGCGYFAVFEPGEAAQAEQGTLI
jgi:hypothetical protein